MDIYRYYNLSSQFLEEDLSRDLFSCFRGEIPIIICLGTDKVLSDMVGVFVAEMLKRINLKTYIFGGLKSQINNTSAKLLTKKLQNKNLLFIDSGLFFVGSNFESDSHKNSRIMFSSKIILNNGEVLKYPSIIAQTIHLKNNNLDLAKTRYLDVLLFSKKIANSICRYFSLAKIMNSKFTK